MSIPVHEQGLVGFKLPPAPEEGVPRLTYQLARMWNRRGRLGGGGRGRDRL